MDATDDEVLYLWSLLLPIFIHLRPKYSPQDPVFKYPQPEILP